MPIMDGIEATKHIRTYFNDTLKINFTDQPVIVGITGHAQESFKRAGYDAGMNDIINKPIYKDVLMEVLFKYKIIQN